MRWWKFGVVASIVWILVVFGLAGGLLWNIAAHPMGQAVDDARDAQAGKAIGGLLVSGLAAIWGMAYTRHRSAKPPR